MTQRLLAAVPVTAASLTAFEVLMHRQMLFVSDSLSALTAIPIAVMGIAFGGLIADRVLDDPDAPRRLSWALWGSLVFGVVALPAFGEWLPTLSPLLMAPYAIGGALLSIAFARIETRRVYPLDLTAAAAGIGGVAISLPWLGEEGLHIALLVLASLGPVILSTNVRLPMMVTQLCSVLLIVQLGWGPYHLAMHTGQILPAMREAERRPGTGAYSKTFDLLRRHPLLEPTGSYSTASGRIDVVRIHNPRIDFGFELVAENGNVIDLMLDKPASAYRWDIRVPRYLLPDTPDIFIFGTAGEGILKPSVHLGGYVLGAEVDTAVLSFAKDQHPELCGHCYDGVEVEADDGRATLARSGRRFDYITLLNTHVSKGPARRRAADAEFMHTHEAMRELFDHLTPDGMIGWEHPVHTSAEGKVAIRQLATAFAVLEERGHDEPWRHTVVWGWRGYEQTLVAAEPLDDEDLRGLKAWADHEGDMLPEWKRALGAELSFFYVPGRPGQTRGVVGKWVLARSMGRHLAPMVAEPPTDDHPFPHAFDDSRAELLSALGMVAGLGGLAVLVLLGATRRAAAAVPWRRETAVAVLSGAAYLFVEALYLHHLPMLVGSPGVVLGVVLTSMLVATGVGGAVAHRLSKGARRGALIALPVGIALVGLGLGPVARAVMDVSPWLRGLLGVLLVIPIAALMGLPLTLALSRARAREERLGALLFAINGAAGSVGVLAALVAAVQLGLSGAWLLGALLYGGVALLLW